MKDGPSGDTAQCELAVDLGIDVRGKPVTSIGDSVPGDPREFEQKNYPVARLGSLGKKLLSLEPWS
jgi:hypothetical protein